MTTAKAFRFESEAAMCAAFIRDADRQGWTAYPETWGFDILLVHRETRLQCGVEAKQTFNAEVVAQAVKDIGREVGPDYRAVLVPEGGSSGLAALARQLGVVVIRARGEPDDKGMTAARAGRWRYLAFHPELPAKQDFEHASRWSGEWPQHSPDRQCPLPDYVPDVVAGASAPVALTAWKIAAIKIAVLLAKRGHVSRADFNALEISMSRWTQMGWIVKEGGRWVRGHAIPDFRAQHPVNFDQIEADFPKWSAAVDGKGAPLFATGAPS